MEKLRKDIRLKIKITLPAYVRDWLETATASRSVLHWTESDMITCALQAYMFLPEDTPAGDGTGSRACCYTAPDEGHRGTCRYSATCGGPDSTEYQALKRMWANQAPPEG